MNLMKVARSSCVRFRSAFAETNDWAEIIDKRWHRIGDWVA